MITLNRRAFLGLASFAGLGAIAAPGTPTTTPPAALPSVPDEFPTQSPALAREMVGVSHGNLVRVNELLKLHPTLANAAWDWGFGDWETALGAASHVGNVDIAMALLAHGARPSIFSAAMLGQLGVVRAFVEASPGIQATAGPHGITLLSHAKAGGPAAKPVLDYLVDKGGADPAPQTVELPAALMERFTGVYAFGAREIDRVAITIEKGGVRFKRGDSAARNLTYVGDNAFRPAGAPLVRVRFTLAGDQPAAELSVFDPDLVLRATRAT